MVTLRVRQKYNKIANAPQQSKFIQACFKVFKFVIALQDRKI